MPLFLIFIIFPLTELLVFVLAGQAIGYFKAVLLLFAAAFLGAAIVKYQGIEMLAQSRTSLLRRKLPQAEIFEGVCVIAAGILLMIPGFASDALGLLLLVPPLRTRLRGWISARGQYVATSEEASWTNRPGPGYDPEAIEVDFERVDKERPRGPGDRA